MRKWINFLMAALVGSSVSYLQADAGQATFEVGYRRDNVSWRQKDDSSFPGFESSTRFENVDIIQLGLRGRTNIGCNVYVRGAATWGWVLEGDFEQTYATTAGAGGSFEGSSSSSTTTVEDSDSSSGVFNALRRVAKQKDIVDDQYVYGIDFAFGYPFYFCDCSLAVAPTIGYAFDEQNFRVQNSGFKLDSGSTGEEVAGLVIREGSDCSWHKFVSRWYGPYVGFDLGYKPATDCWSIGAEIAWRFRNQFKAKRHDDATDGRDFHASHAHGWLFRLAADYELCNCWLVGASFAYQDLSVTKHNHHSGSESSLSLGDGIHTNKWRSFNLNLAIGHKF